MLSARAKFALQENPYLQRYDSVTRYALVVSIRATAGDIDIYTPVANLIAGAVEIAG